MKWELNKARWAKMSAEVWLNNNREYFHREAGRGKTHNNCLYLLYLLWLHSRVTLIENEIDLLCNALQYELLHFNRLLCSVKLLFIIAAPLSQIVHEFRICLCVRNEKFSRKPQGKRERESGRDGHGWRAEPQLKPGVAQLTLSLSLSKCSQLLGTLRSDGDRSL